jgi:hypothetical protein
MAAPVVAIPTIAHPALPLTRKQVRVGGTAASQAMANLEFSLVLPSSRKTQIDG